ncbi:MAG: hypothetical protein AAB320_06115 [Elusimicrobiota bacterium]
MKTILALLLLSMACVSRAAAVEPAKSQEAAAARECPCDSRRFVGKSAKAKAAVEYNEARRYYRSAKGLGGIFGLFGILAHDVKAISDAQHAIDEAAGRLSAARARAESLGAIKSTPGAEADAPVAYLLVLHVDYEMTR